MYIFGVDLKFGNQSELYIEHTCMYPTHAYTTSHTH